ncbi:MAG TPA: ABC transporter substrate-binding protein [Methylomusa anaerophila]|uniref:ABC transporter substrate binding protein n=1 Tax=Methylomusa anaerophila TaxID=1930071 RepID=A0A348ANQ0_9FIRM|nr:ABC transporter substrate-binding protein [Methylomusa anaerophila]BBB92698.1 ABC transporter substrate binding protein [Methylomusa anaerophila]HML87449.1 ABC transporter substrate-binding protein [Methylomusa anaerophila]
MYHIGILQLTQNLDDAVNGFKDGLTEAGITADFFYLNADGALADLAPLAKKLAERNVDLIFACSTPAAQAAVNLPGSIPVVFTPVFDPVGAGLAASLDWPGGKATGVSGMVPAAAKVEFIAGLLPQAKNIGMLYHTGDSNALVEAGNFRDAAQNRYPVIEIPINKPEDLSNLPELLTSDIDVLFLPIGRIVEENFPSVVYYTDVATLPVIASHAPNVPAGAIGALVANHSELGRASAVKAGQILAGAAPGTIPVSIVEKPEIHLNSFVAQNLGINIASDLIAAAKEVFF